MFGAKIYAKLLNVNKNEIIDLGTEYPQNKDITNILSPNYTGITHIKNKIK